MARVAPQFKRIVLVIYFVAACFCAMALIVAVSRSAELGIALVIVEVAVVLLLRSVGAVYDRQLRRTETSRAVTDRPYSGV